MHTPLHPAYQLNKRGRAYTISQVDGKDLFYYRPSNYELTGIDYPHNLSVNIPVFGDQLMAYCANQIAFSYISEEKLEFYLVSIFNRLLKDKNCELFFIEDCVLDRNGAYNEMLHDYFNDRYIDIYVNPDAFYQVKEAYSLKYNTPLFLYINKEINRKELCKDAFKIPRKLFESVLVSEQLGDAYVEEYHPNSSFYFEKNKGIGSFSDYFTGVFFMVLEQRVQLLIFVSKDLPAHKDILLYELPFVN